MVLIMKVMINARHLRALVMFVLIGTGITLFFSTSNSSSSARLGIFRDSSPEDPGEALAQCIAHRHIMFLKTHKCASSTVQNIFLRYGFKHNLTFALPATGNYLGNPSLFTADLVPKNLLPQSGKVDIFAVHTRLNPVEHTKILQNDTRWITIIRDPTTLYESMFSFFHMGEVYKIDLSKYSEDSIKKLETLPRFGRKYGKNQMLFDLGYPDSMSVEQLRAAIASLDDLFDLVMISELMDESLILLRHLLCWSLHDVVYFTKNARREEVKRPLPPKVLSGLRNLNSADVILYDYFLVKHRKAVADFGVKKMADEVAALRNLRDEYYEDCGTHEVGGHDTHLRFMEYSGLVKAYISSNNSDQNCLLLTLPELHLVDTIRKHQMELLKPKQNPS